jgi:hypothetical protein
VKKAELQSTVDGRCTWRDEVARNVFLTAPTDSALIALKRWKEAADFGANFAHEFFATNFRKWTRGKISAFGNSGGTSGLFGNGEYT